MFHLGRPQRSAIRYGPQKVRSISRSDLLQPILVVQSAEHILYSYSTIPRQFMPGILQSRGSLFWNSPDRPAVFKDLLFRRSEPRFYAFDLLWAKGQDLRFLPLIERKHRLRSVVPQRGERLPYVDHIEGPGDKLFDAVCRNDLEGMVAKLKRGTRTSDRQTTSWIKIKDRAYSGRRARRAV